ncbi:MAG: hypothetical protein WCJ85_03935 [Chitinophagaceae bacterium]
MYQSKLLLLLLLLVTTIGAYYTHILVQRILPPKRSFGHFLGYVVLHMISIFVLVFLAGFVVFYFKEFFFKK